MIIIAHERKIDTLREKCNSYLLYISVPLILSTLSYIIQLFKRDTVSVDKLLFNNYLLYIDASGVPNG